MNEDGNQRFVTALAAQHDRMLRRFLESRLRHAVADVPDLMQEIFLRMMRVPNPESIRTPEAYLFTVAKAVLHQHRARKAGVPEAVDISDVLAELEEDTALGPEAQLDAKQRLSELKRAMAQLPPRAYVTLVLNRVAGMPLEQIAERLGVSRPMAKKYLAKALAHCRQHQRDVE